jgi:hypothetical protein
MSKKSEFEQAAAMLQKISKKEEEARDKLDAAKGFSHDTTGDYRFMSIGRGELQVKRDIAISFHAKYKENEIDDGTCSAGGTIDWIPECLPASTKKMLLKHSDIVKKQTAAANKIISMLANAFKVPPENISILDCGEKCISIILETSKDEFNSVYFSMYIEATDEGLKKAMERYESLRAKLIADGYLKLESRK